MSKLPKICIIYTGGTIGMIRGKDDALRPPENPRDFLTFAPELSEIVEYDYVPLMNKDSTNINPCDWRDMADAVYDRMAEEMYDGFVIAHGTDTMHFSSSALAFAFGPNINVPIVFTGSQTPPEVKHGDARTNLLRACKVAASNVAEVVISFGDFVFRGCRAQKKDEKRFDAFESPAYYPICYITESIEVTPLAKHSQKRQGEPISYRPFFASGVLQVSLIPGLEPEIVIPSVEHASCQGVILQSFGAGNVPHEAQYSLIPVIERAKELNKPTIITSQFPGHSTLGTEYEAGIIAHEAGAMPTGNMTSAAATVKFRWVLAQVLAEIAAGKVAVEDKLQQVKKLMNSPYVGEMD
jgi:L-asparaginase type I